MTGHTPWAEIKHKKDVQLRRERQRAQERYEKPWFDKWILGRRIKFGYIWGQEIGEPECPYVKRWVLNLGLFSLRLHRWVGSDDARYLHDHSWWFLTFVLKGGYWDVTGENDQEMEIGGQKMLGGRHYEGVGPAVDGYRWAFRHANHRHSVEVVEKPTWTLLLTGPEKRVFGFWVDGVFKPVRTYFREHGHHPCDDSATAREARRVAAGEPGKTRGPVPIPPLKRDS